MKNGELRKLCGLGLGKLIQRTRPEDVWRYLRTARASVERLPQAMSRLEEALDRDALGVQHVQGLTQCAKALLTAGKALLEGNME
eukprot:CAMPEP_0115288844 /NCGR_PEP_ID=MMETSP0270-20121206/63188_1 /TAXON_ID=71861 /ORGANISM="Scrippsiella trochoidea, Strain CCMP3099" /LENGTH=84 /DNA_ID=CAMNT_0002705975 /DNA_START=596 /DNA_END=850 /DNA_ORIENTATION=+